MGARPVATVAASAQPGRPRAARARPFLADLPRPFRRDARLHLAAAHARLRLPRLLTREVTAVRDLDSRAIPASRCRSS
jgi:hypothetical protein